MLSVLLFWNLRNKFSFVKSNILNRFLITEKDKTVSTLDKLVTLFVLW